MFCYWKRGDRVFFAHGPGPYTVKRAHRDWTAPDYDMVELEEDVPPEFYDYVRRKLVEAGYEHAIHHDGGGEGAETLDMHGIALRALPRPAEVGWEEGGHAK
jgi:hypothetical protein